MTVDRDSSLSYVYRLLLTMMEQGGSDLYITEDAAPSIKLNGEIKPLSKQILNQQTASALVRSIMNDRQRKEYDEMKECNFSFSVPKKARFRVNAFTQRGCSGMVLRHIPTEIPNFDTLGLPPILRDLALVNRGLIMLVGATSSGKSTTMSAMVDYRNERKSGHIVTIEDPIEFIYEHKKSLITQRELGLDTYSYQVALKNTLRQAPDVIVIGEIRDRETMEYALAYAETGHLCISTMHATSATHAFDRILNLFPESRRQQTLMDLSMNMKAIIGQRLVRANKGEKDRVVAAEIMMNSPMVSDRIARGEFGEMKELVGKSKEQGMQTMDQALFDLIESGAITVQEGLRNADSVNDLRLRLKLESRFTQGQDFLRGTEKISLEPMDKGGL